MSVRAIKTTSPRVHASAYVDPQASLIGAVEVGAESSIWPMAVQSGDEVSIGHRVVLHGCTFGNRCLIGIGAVILDGAVLHDHVLRGAGSLVTEGKELAGGYLYLGSPARQVRRLTEEEIAYFGYAAAHYVKLKEKYKIGG